MKGRAPVVAQARRAVRSGAQRREPWERMWSQASPERATPKPPSLIENVSRIVIYAGFLQYNQELLLEITPSVMLGLIPDIFFHRRNLRWAHAESSISCLPRKSTMLLAHP